MAGFVIPAPQPSGASQAFSYAFNKTMDNAMAAKLQKEADDRQTERLKMLQDQRQAFEAESQERQFQMNQELALMDTPERALARQQFELNVIQTEGAQLVNKANIENLRANTESIIRQPEERMKQFYLNTVENQIKQDQEFENVKRIAEWTRGTPEQRQQVEKTAAEILVSRAHAKYLNAQAEAENNPFFKKVKMVTDTGDNLLKLGESQKKIVDDPLQPPEIRDAMSRQAAANMLNATNMFAYANGLVTGLIDPNSPAPSIVTSVDVEPIFTQAFQQKTNLTEMIDIAAKAISTTSAGGKTDLTDDAKEKWWSLNMIRSGISEGRPLAPETMSLAKLVDAYGVNVTNTVIDGNGWFEDTTIGSLINEGRVDEIFSNPEYKQNLLEQVEGKTDSVSKSLTGLLKQSAQKAVGIPLTPEVVISRYKDLLQPSDVQKLNENRNNPAALQRAVEILDAARTKVKAATQSTVKSNKYIQYEPETVKKVNPLVQMFRDEKNTSFRKVIADTHRQIDERRRKKAVR